jgi:predicted amidohydrolase
MSRAHAQHVKLIVYPEIAFTTFFPRTLFTDPQELESYFERDVDGDPTKAPGMKPIFDQARTFQMDVSLGYAECDTSIESSDQDHRHFNTAVYYSAAADKMIAKYRKVHLSGTFEPVRQPKRDQPIRETVFPARRPGFRSLPRSRSYP